MATLGVDCEIILDGTGYFVKPGSYLMHQPRVRKATVRADNGEGYVDLGAGKRVWKMVILCMNDLLNYDGSTASLNGQQFRAALRNSYTASAGTTITYYDPIGGGVSVHFDDYLEHIHDLHSQVIALATEGGNAASYEVAITLVEA